MRGAGYGTQDLVHRIIQLAQVLGRHKCAGHELIVDQTLLLDHRDLERSAALQVVRLVATKPKRILPPQPVRLQATSGALRTLMNLASSTGLSVSMSTTKILLSQSSTSWLCVGTTCIQINQ